MIFLQRVLQLSCSERTHRTLTHSHMHIYLYIHTHTYTHTHIHTYTHTHTHTYTHTHTHTRTHTYTHTHAQPHGWGGAYLRFGIVIPQWTHTKDSDSGQFSRKIDDKIVGIATGRTAVLKIVP